MPITTIQNGLVATNTPIGSRNGPAHTFSTVLASQSKIAVAPQQEPPKAQIADSSAVTDLTGKDVPISLGKISDASPSVSHLLINHPGLHEQCWNIIFSTINQGKQFDTMLPDVEVFLDPSTKEITWQDRSSQPVPVTEATVDNSSTPSVDTELVNIGSINSGHPTISHLLKKHPDYTNKAWDIIFSPANRNIPYDTLPLGTLVFIDPKTSELSFQKAETAKLAQADDNKNTAQDTTSTSAQAVPDSDGFAKKFVDSVKTYLGRPYQKINCYGLVVRGLEDIGVNYKGTDGLRQHLVQMATDKGLRHNAYHNGEGLIEIAGTKLFDESFSAIKNAEQQADEVMNKIKPLLKEGMLLSFSTPYRGHTGVVSQKNGEWTYVNSGVIDHQVDGGKTTKRVGEETLAEEMTNWFKLAKNKRTSLKVSAGMFDTEKLKDKARFASLKPPAKKG